MHYYKRNIGDYAKKAGRLSMLEHGAYVQLIDACYDKEKFPTLEEAIDWIWAKPGEEENAVKFVLSRFFTRQDDDTYVQNRIQEELDIYHAKAQANAINGKMGGRPKGAKNKTKKTQMVNSETQSVNLKSEINPSGTEINPNQEPRTTNQEPLTKPPKSPKGDHVRFDDFYSAYPRKAARAQALKAWNKLKPNFDLINDILDDIPRRIASGQFDINDKSFIPYPATYLNRRGWEDEIIQRGVSHGTRQQPGGNRKLSTVARVRQANDIEDIDQQIRDAEAEEAFEAGVDSVGGNLWERGGQPVGGGDAGDVGTVAEGILVN